MGRCAAPRNVYWIVRRQILISVAAVVEIRTIAPLLEPRVIVANAVNPARVHFRASIHPSATSQHLVVVRASRARRFQISVTNAEACACSAVGTRSIAAAPIVARHAAADRPARMEPACSVRRTSKTFATTSASISQATPRLAAAAAGKKTLAQAACASGVSAFRAKQPRRRQRRLRLHRRQHRRRAVQPRHLRQRPQHQPQRRPARPQPRRLRPLPARPIATAPRAISAKAATVH